MNKVVVTFVGICTHIEKVPMTPPYDAVHGRCLPFGRYRRTVMVNGHHGLHLRTARLHPHDAMLGIPIRFLVDPHPRDLPGLKWVGTKEEKKKKKEEDDDECAFWRMEGVRLYIQEATGHLEPLTEWFQALPSLTERADVLSLQLDERVVQDGRAAAVFDVFAGQLDAYRHAENKPAFGKLTVDTASANPKLCATEIWSGHSATIALKDAGGEVPHVLVQNIGRGLDQDLDFILHYHTTTWTPPPGQWPQPGELRGVRLAAGEEKKDICPPFSGLSVGCSNSIYP